MDPERWRQIEQLYFAARQRDPVQRNHFLAEACHSDAELRREVESLLASGGSAEPLAAETAWGEPGDTPSPAAILTLGARLGPYQILGPLGLEREYTALKIARV